MGPQVRELYARLRGLRERAEQARSRDGLSRSQAVVQARVRASAMPGASAFRGKRVSDWAPEHPDRFKVPQDGSDDQVLALVVLWASWAGEAADERWWREQLERARTEHAAARRSPPGPPQQPGEDPTQTVTTAGPAVLEVHRAALPHTEKGPAPALPELTPYLPRAHDIAIRSALTPALDGGPSVLVMLTGDSSTGKTRALYEALCDLAPHHPLLRPRTAVELLHLLDTGRVTAGVVLWLNETQRHLYGHDSEQAAAALLQLLHTRPGVVAVGTLWPDPYWADLAATGAPEDPHSHARALLTATVTHRIDVTSTLAEDERARWRELADRQDDRRLAAALKAGAADGRVVQHLSGGPELLAAYQRGPGDPYTPVDHALITAALDARRLGHHAPIPAALLADAADGALTDRTRPGDPDWAEHALTALSTGERHDGTRTDIRRALTPLTALRSRGGTPAHYEPADYLDQHTRLLRVDQLGTPSLWQGLLDHTTDPADLARLADAAWERTLYRQAVLLGRKAVAAGAPGASATLLHRLATLDDPSVPRAARWIAAHTDLSSPKTVDSLLGRFRHAGAEEGVAVLLGRRPQDHLDLADPLHITFLLEELRETGAEEAVRTVVHRIVTEAPITDTVGATFLLEWLREAGEDKAAEAVARQVADHADLTDPHAAAGMLRSLARLGTGEAAAVLARRIVGRVDVAAWATAAAVAPPVPRRIPDQVDLTEWTTAALLGKAMAVDAGRAVDTAASRVAAAAGLTRPRTAALLLKALRDAGADEATDALAHQVAGQVSLTDPQGLALLLEQLRKAGPAEAMSALLGRDPHLSVDLTDPLGAARLLEELRKTGATEAAGTVARRAADEAELTESRDVVRLLAELWAIREDEGVQKLLDRHPEIHADLTDPRGVALLLRELCTVEVWEAVHALLDRHPEAQADLSDLDSVVHLLEELVRIGADQAAGTLAHRVITEADPTQRNMAATMLKWLGPEAANTLAHRIVDHTDLTDTNAVNLLLDDLMRAHAHQAAGTLAQRVMTTTTDPHMIVRLLGRLRADAADALTHRAAREAALTDPAAVASLLEALRTTGATQALATLLDRRPEIHAVPTPSHGVKSLLKALRAAGAPQAADTLACRATRAGREVPMPVPRYGREADWRPAARWTWDDLPPLPDEG
ncbi:hypothetical protein ACFV2X_22065 [Streptomyces sp. NPDC059679]|uniref:hypothetical protein n=1 Tax=Streptomyces sp. NPDC059679 TaxID=3346903 RepID=UPI00369BB279